MTIAIPGLPPPRPSPIKDPSSILFLEKGRLDVLDGASCEWTKPACARTSRLEVWFV
jgi:hypothetical protein